MFLSAVLFVKFSIYNILEEKQHYGGKSEQCVEAECRCAAVTVCRSIEFLSAVIFILSLSVVTQYLQVVQSVSVLCKNPDVHTTLCKLSTLMLLLPMLLVNL